MTQIKISFLSSKKQTKKTELCQGFSEKENREGIERVLEKELVKQNRKDLSVELSPCAYIQEPGIYDILENCGKCYSSPQFF